MLLLVGLGNPGNKYQNNRHNVGFMAVDEIIRRFSFSGPKNNFQAEVYEGRIGSEKALILKPQTFMNLSGQAVGEAARYFKIDVSDIIVLYDELDLPAGKIKFKTGGGTAGHNGLKSMNQHLGDAYHRVRIGIGHPGDRSKVSNHVLGDFAKADQQWLDPLLDAIANAAPELAQKDGGKFLGKVALKINPPRNSGTKKNNSKSEEQD